MERESFENEEVADMLNRHFVSIKVDREERPDIDHIYMTVCQALTGQGGWPLTIVMTPDQKPFYAGTYFPKTTRHGRIGLMEMLSQLAEKWENDRDRVLEASRHLLSHIEPQLKGTTAGLVTRETLDEAYADFSSHFDARFGGFSGAPKFPTPHNLLFLLRYAQETKQPKALAMVEKTLTTMRQGGIYDHVGYGFSRYSVDDMWLVPHFEKMLYDNALLTYTYAEAYQVTGNVSFAHTAAEIIEYVLRDMQAPDGGFYSAEDADSEGEEGKFYVWSLAEIERRLGPDLAARYCRYYNITASGNFEGHNIPNRIGGNEAEFLASEGIDEAEWRVALRQANDILFQAREARIHPHKDDKILTAWNGLMIAALAKAGCALQRDDFLEAGARAVHFIRQSLVRAEDGRLLARYRDGEAKYLAYVDDYACLIWGLLEMYEATFDERYIEFSLELQDDMNRLFWDAQSGGYFMYGEDSESLIARPKEIYDGAMPSGNSIAAWNLLRLARMTGRTAYETRAQQLFDAFAGAVDTHPTSYSMFLIALQFAIRPTLELVIAGDVSDSNTALALHEMKGLYRPDAVKLFHPSAEAGDRIRTLIPMISEQTALSGKTTLYVCENFSCQQPTHDFAAQFAKMREKHGDNV